jgi:endonuclease/exonuclease/phosphatase family metal-dependent hydrolase
MTYNILVSADLQSEGKYRWSLRRDDILGQIQAMRPAILGLQEVSRVQKADLRKTLAGYSFEGISGETSALAIDRSAFSVRSSGSFWLGPRPLVRAKGWDAAYTRTANWAHLLRKGDGRQVLALNTHLDNQGRRARLESVKQITAWISQHRKAGEAIALMGDLNSLPEWPPIRELSSSALGLRDARAITKSPPVGPEGTTRNLRADYIFVGPTVEVESYTVLAPDEPGAPAPSDHFPVVADLRTCGS